MMGADDFLQLKTWVDTYHIVNNNMWGHTSGALFSGWLSAQKYC